MLGNYSFLIPGKLAGAAMPGSFAPLKEDLAQAKRDGIGAVAALTETASTATAAREAGLEYKHIPVDDFSPPTMKQFREFVEFVDEQNAREHAVLVHCRAGIGRTGTMLAAYLIAKGASARDAVEKLRQARPSSVETANQLQALYEWEQQVVNGTGA